MTSHEEEQLYALALSLAHGISRVVAKQLIETIGSAADVFRFRRELPERCPDISPHVLKALDDTEAVRRAEQELAFARNRGIRCLTLLDEDYPSRLRECDDAPVALFYKGTANLNAPHALSMVGTRRATDYGTRLCATFLRDLKEHCPDALVVSGLAYGIDIHAHREALANGLPTVAVLAHGLDRIYPYVHRKTAIDMLENGGLLTEFVTGTNPDKRNFVCRNRIVAGMTDATLVVESAAKGGSLITAELAESYHRDCFAFPGRLNDACSEGCNRLISTNRAALLLSAEEFVKTMGWESPAKAQSIQRSLFPDLTEEEQRVVSLLRERGNLHINTLVVATDTPVQRMSTLLLEMEMKGIVRLLAGGMYQLLD